MPTRRRRPLVKDLNPNLTCFLCGGYYIDATTLTECLHSYCKTCIIKFLETSKNCPICDVPVHKTKPHLHLKLDKTLQDLVYKTVGGLFRDEMKRRRDFYGEHPESAPSRVGEERGDENAERMLYCTDDTFSLALHFCNRVSKDGHTARALSIPEVSANTKKTLEPCYLKCLGGVTVHILKKFVRLKYELHPRFVVDMFHSDHVLRDEYTLVDIAYMYTWRKREPLSLSYSVYEVIMARRRLDVASRLLSRVKQEKTAAAGDTDLKPDLQRLKKEDTKDSLPGPGHSGHSASQGPRDSVLQTDQASPSKIAKIDRPTSKHSKPETSSSSTLKNAKTGSSLINNKASKTEGASSKVRTEESASTTNKHPKTDQSASSKDTPRTPQQFSVKKSKSPHSKVNKVEGGSQTKHSKLEQQSPSSGSKTVVSVPKGSNIDSSVSKSLETTLMKGSKPEQCMGKTKGQTSASAEGSRRGLNVASSQPQAIQPRTSAAQGSISSLIPSGLTSQGDSQPVVIVLQPPRRAEGDGHLGLGERRAVNTVEVQTSATNSGGGVLVAARQALPISHHPHHPTLLPQLSMAGTKPPSSTTATTLNVITLGSPSPLLPPPTSSQQQTLMACQVSSATATTPVTLVACHAQPQAPQHNLQPLGKKALKRTNGNKTSDLSPTSLPPAAKKKKAVSLLPKVAAAVDGSGGLIQLRPALPSDLQQKGAPSRLVVPQQLISVGGASGASGANAAGPRAVNQISLLKPRSSSQAVQVSPSSPLLLPKQASHVLSAAVTSHSSLPASQRSALPATATVVTSQGLSTQTSAVTSQCLQGTRPVWAKGVSSISSSLSGRRTPTTTTSAAGKQQQHQQAASGLNNNRTKKTSAVSASGGGGGSGVTFSNAGAVNSVNTQTPVSASSVSAVVSHANIAKAATTAAASPSAASHSKLIQVTSSTAAVFNKTVSSSAAGTTTALSAPPVAISPRPILPAVSKSKSLQQQVSISPRSVTPASSPLLVTTTTKTNLSAAMQVSVSSSSRTSSVAAGTMTTSVLSAAAGAAGAASPSPAALAASSSPSPPMASSAASVREDGGEVGVKGVTSAGTCPVQTAQAVSRHKDVAVSVGGSSGGVGHGSNRTMTSSPSPAETAAVRRNSVGANCAAKKIAPQKTTADTVGSSLSETKNQAEHKANIGLATSTGSNSRSSSPCVDIQQKNAAAALSSGKTLPAAALSQLTEAEEDSDSPMVVDLTCGSEDMQEFNASSPGNVDSKAVSPLKDCAAKAKAVSVSEDHSKRDKFVSSVTSTHVDVDHPKTVTAAPVATTGSAVSRLASLGGRNGMPSVVARPARGVNAATSVNTLSPRLPPATTSAVVSTSVSASPVNASHRVSTGVSVSGPKLSCVSTATASNTATAVTQKSSLPAVSCQGVSTSTTTTTTTTVMTTGQSSENPGTPKLGLAENAVASSGTTSIQTYSASMACVSKPAVVTAGSSESASVLKTCSSISQPVATSCSSSNSQPSLTTCSSTSNSVPVMSCAAVTVSSSGTLVSASAVVTSVCSSPAPVISQTDTAVPNSSSGESATTTTTTTTAAPGEPNYNVSVAATCGVLGVSSVTTMPVMACASLDTESTHDPATSACSDKPTTSATGCGVPATGNACTVSDSPATTSTTVGLSEAAQSGVDSHGMSSVNQAVTSVSETPESSPSHAAVMVISSDEGSSPVATTPSSSSSTSKVTGQAAEAVVTSVCVSNVAESANSSDAVTVGSSSVAPAAVSVTQSDSVAAKTSGVGGRVGEVKGVKRIKPSPFPPLSSPVLLPPSRPRASSTTSPRFNQPFPAHMNIQQILAAAQQNPPQTSQISTPLAHSHTAPTTPTGRPRALSLSKQQQQQQQSSGGRGASTPTQPKAAVTGVVGGVSVGGIRPTKGGGLSPVSAAQGLVGVPGSPVGDGGVGALNPMYMSLLAQQRAILMQQAMASHDAGGGGGQVGVGVGMAGAQQQQQQMLQLQQFLGMRALAAIAQYPVQQQALMAAAVANPLSILGQVYSPPVSSAANALANPTLIPTSTTITTMTPDSGKKQEGGAKKGGPSPQQQLKQQRLQQIQQQQQQKQQQIQQQQKQQKLQQQLQQQLQIQQKQQQQQQLQNQPKKQQHQQQQQQQHQQQQQKQQHQNHHQQQQQQQKQQHQNHQQQQQQQQKQQQQNHQQQQQQKQEQQQQPQAGGAGKKAGESGSGGGGGGGSGGKKKITDIANSLHRKAVAGETTAHVSDTPTLASSRPPPVAHSSSSSSATSSSALYSQSTLSAPSRTDEDQPLNLVVSRP